MRAIAVVAIVAVAVGLGLSSCAADTTDYSAQTARPFQEQVLAVADGVAADQLDVSLTRLDELAVSLKDARARGAVSAERYASISAAVGLVRGDLETAIAAQLVQQQEQQQEEQKAKDEKPGKGPGKKKP